MALPVILIDSATGSDTLASGAGPSTALTGSSASTDGAGTLATLDGSPDLTNVATDGSHVIFLNDTTAGARNFGKITAKDNAAKTVTVSDAFGLSLSGKSWAIGGKRASLFGTTSVKLISNNSAAGDAMPGWMMRMSSGHTETSGGGIVCRRAGSSTSGPITIEGVDGAATLPILTFSNNGAAFTNGGTTAYQGWRFRNFEMQNSNATKTASVAFSPLTSASGTVYFENIKINHATNKFWKGIVNGGGGTSTLNFILVNCSIKNCASTGLEHVAAFASAAFTLYGCEVRDCGSHGVNLTPGNSTTSSISAIFSQFTGNGGRGIYCNDATANSSTQSCSLTNCVVHGNASHGVEMVGSQAIAHVVRLVNNNLTGNGTGGTGYGFSTGCGSLVQFGSFWIVDRNNTGTGGTANATGRYNGLDSFFGTNDPQADPGYVNSGSGDFTNSGTGVRGLGFPQSVGSSTPRFDIGLQQSNSGSSGGSYASC